jgi:Uma2 family endonuclease
MIQHPLQPSPLALGNQPCHPFPIPDETFWLAPEEPDWATLNEDWESDEPELESDFHRDQIDLLLRLMRWIWRDRDDIYCSGNTTVYYDSNQQTTRNFRGPDIYVALGAIKRSRRSWMVWNEGGRYPNLVIELLSKSTATVDRTLKKELYQTTWRLPNYFWFHPETKEFKGFRLVDGLYEPIVPNALGQLWSDELELFLGLHEGFLRLFTPDGLLLLYQEEEEALRAELAEQRAELAEQRTETAEQRADRAEDALQAERDRSERLAAQLRELGIED